MNRRLRKFAAVLALLLPLPVVTGCGFHPLYSDQYSVSDKLAQVDIEPQKGTNGQKLNLMLEDRFYGLKAKEAAPRWRLHLESEISKDSLLISSEEDTPTRVRVTATAKMELYESGQTLPAYSVTQRAYASYNVLTDPYATLAAEEDAVERSLTQLADRVTNGTAIFLASVAERDEAVTGALSSSLSPPPPAALTP